MSICGTSERLSPVSGESDPRPAAAIEEAIAAVRSLAPDTVGDRLHFTFVNREEDEYSFRCRTAPWMANVAGSLHGGMSAAIVDQAMGYVVYAIQPGPGFSPTVQMQLCYHRSVVPGKEMIVKVFVMSRGKTTMHLRAKLYHADAPDRLCVSATGMYQYIPVPPKK